MQRAAKHIVVLIAVVSFAVALAACDRSEGGVANKDAAVAASVNGKNITLGEVDKIISEQAKSQQSQMSDMSDLERGAARLQVLDDLIKQEVLFQRAEKEKLLPSDDEVTQAINEQMQQNGLTPEAYQKKIKDGGLTEQGVRDLARKQLAIKKLLSRTTSKITPPSDKELEDFYNGNRARYVNARGVELAAIVVDPADNGATNDAKNETDAKNKIDIIYQRLKSGADFASVAREQSEDQSALRGGDVGFYTEEQLKQSGFPDDLIAKFFSSMQPGDITPPVKGSGSAGGRWSIFKLTQKRLQSENLTLDNPDVRRDIADNITNQRQQILNEALLEASMADAKIVNNLAQDMLNSPGSLSSLRPAGSAAPKAAATPRPASSSSPAAAPAASASPKK